MDTYDSDGTVLAEIRNIPKLYLVTDDTLIYGDKWKHGAYFIMDHPLSTAVIVEVDSNGRPIE